MMAARKVPDDDGALFPVSLLGQAGEDGQAGLDDPVAGQGGAASTADSPAPGTGHDDPAGAEFDMYAVEPPPEPWSYVLDDCGITYRRGLVAQRLRRGWWPFAYAEEGREQSARRPPRGDRVPPECGVAHLRLTPDTEYRAWRNEIVLAGPDTMVAHLASARLRLRVRQQGMGGIVITCRMRLDLQAQTAAVDRTGDDWPAELTAQAETKGGQAAGLLRRRHSRTRRHRRTRMPGNGRRPGTAALRRPG